MVAASLHTIGEPCVVGANTSGLTIASSPAAIARGMGELNSRQIAVLDQLPEFGSKPLTMIGQ